jgi:hypothetical protein
MNAAAQSFNEDRIARLERSLRFMKLGWLVLLLLIIALALIWYGVGGIAQRQITVRRILVLDAAGVPRMRLGEDQGNGRQSKATGLVLMDSTGHERGGMATMANGRVVMGLDAPYIKGQSPDRAGMMVDDQGHFMFFAVDNQGAPVMLLKAGDSGGALQVMQLSADKKQMQVRTLGVNGDTQSTMNGGN